MFIQNFHVYNIFTAAAAAELCLHFLFTLLGVQLNDAERDMAEKLANKQNKKKRKEKSIDKIL